MGKSRRTSSDREIDAISAILRSLEGLDGETIRRVLDYVFSRLSISAPSHMKSVGLPTAVATVSSPEGALRMPRVSIRDLKEEKQPESSNQMAALVAFYLSEIAGEDERKDSIGASDLEKYFKQASFRLPKSPSQTLPNAAAAGYFDALGNGAYRLNAVGYNLVAHGLPRGHSPEERRRPKRRKPNSPKGKERS